MVQTDSWFEQFLACPDCVQDLSLTPTGATCSCGFRVGRSAQVDLRPQNPSPRNLRAPIGSTAGQDLSRVDISRPPKLYRGPRPQRDSSELFSAIDRWMKPGISVLDLGCGPRDQRAPVQYYGARYVGLDFTSAAADLLADAHAIPFRAGTFDVVISYAVFEHLYHPFLAAAEVTRVLREGGIFVGVVSQGEPFHHSYFHHTSLGVLEMLCRGGLRPLHVWPSYDTLHALATMGRYPRWQKLLIDVVYRLGRAFPVMSPRKYFRWSAREKQLDEVYRAGSIAFVAEKVREDARES